jgi:hypothetical protein
MHFEDLWEESEKLSHSIIPDNNDSPKEPLLAVIQDIDNNLSIIRNNLLILEVDEQEKALGAAEAIGQILFLLSYLSQRYGINVYAALQSTMNNKKVDHYG